MAVYRNRSRKIAERLFLLHDYLYENAGPIAIKTTDMLTYLASKGHKVEIKTVYSDLKTLEKSFDLSIKYDGGQKGYIIYGTYGLPFSSYDLRLIVNSIQAAQFITQKRADRLTEKIMEIADYYTCPSLNRQTYVPNRVRTIDDNLMWNLDIIYKAIAQERKISYKYFRYTNDRDNPKSYVEIDGSNIITANPIGIIWTSNSYLLFSSTRKADRKYSYYSVPIKQMEQIAILENVRIINPDTLKAYSIFKKSLENAPESSSAGARTILKISNVQIPAVIEKFGKTAKIMPLNDKFSTVSLHVYPDPEIYLWTLELGIKILCPRNADRKLRKYFSDLLNNVPTMRPIFDDDFWEEQNKDDETDFPCFNTYQ